MKYKLCQTKPEQISPARMDLEIWASKFSYNGVIGALTRNWASFEYKHIHSDDPAHPNACMHNMHAAFCLYIYLGALTEFNHVAVFIDETYE